MTTLTEMQLNFIVVGAFLAGAFIMVVSLWASGYKFRRRNPTSIETRNFFRLFGPTYLVRTQSGFVAAQGDFLGDCLPDEIVGFPKSYPSVVSFNYEYRGGGYRLKASTIHVNQLRLKIKDQ